MRKHMIGLFLAISLLLNMFICTAAADNSPSRVIHVVFDDSGSMFVPRGENDSWCQAKYAMEVFAAMLDPNDSMNIYVMSDYESGTEQGPKLKLSGATPALKNVESVHNMPLAGGGTPFRSVEKAYKDLQPVTSASEKWLVVLTDGDFEGVSKTHADDFFSRKADDISVMFLGIGKAAGSINAKADKNIYYKKVDSSEQILPKITEVCQQIFNRQKLDKLSFDIPMSELIIFAQGADVSINGINDGNKLIASKSLVSVFYCDEPAPKYSDAKCATNLTGKIATFKGDFDAGEYDMDITGADTVEIYYSPNIDIQAYLSDASGNEVTNMDKLIAGEYTIKFGFVKKGTNEKVPQSKLLNPVTYSADITNNGESIEYTPGKPININEGSLTVNVSARYMDYNSVVAPQRSYIVYKNKKVSFTMMANPDYIITENGFTNADDPIILKALIEDEDGDFVEFTPEQWAAVDVSEIKLDNKHNLGAFNIKKGVERGILEVRPTVYENNPRKHGIGDFDIDISYAQQVESSLWSSEKTSFTTRIKDDFSWWGRNRQKVIAAAAAMIILLLILFIIWILTRKVYPNKFRVQEVSFVVNRQEMPVNDIRNCCRLNAKKGFFRSIIHLFVSEKQATISVDKPPGYNEQELRCNTTIYVRPASRRITPSRMRRFEICAPMRTTANVRQVQAGTIYERHSSGNNLVPTSDVEKDLENIKISRETDFNRIELEIGSASRLEIKMRKF